MLLPCRQSETELRPLSSTGEYYPDAAPLPFDDLPAVGQSDSTTLVLSVVMQSFAGDEDPFAVLRVVAEPLAPVVFGRASLLGISACLVLD